MLESGQQIIHLCAICLENKFDAHLILAFLINYDIYEDMGMFTKWRLRRAFHHSEKQQPHHTADGFFFFLLMVGFLLFLLLLKLIFG